MTTDQRYMQRCLSLAGKALGYTYPNPLVGSVIVHQGKIIGEGWHTKAGEPHAEVNAIASVKDSSLLKESVLYVNLEPCAHFGKTPPCADLIIEKEIPKVVIGCMDIFSKVAGKGIERLQKAGREVVVGVLENECRALNSRFFTFHSKGRPYIILKWAQTRNGLIAPLRQEQQTPVWILTPSMFFGGNLQWFFLLNGLLIPNMYLMRVFLLIFLCQIRCVIICMIDKYRVSL